MQRTWQRLALLLLPALGLGTSLVLLREYTSDSPALCGVDGGCGAVQNSAFAEFAGIPTPVFGVAFFALLLLARVAPIKGKFERGLAFAGAAIAAVLLGVQAWLVGEFCVYCCIVDASAIAYALLLWRSGERESHAPLQLLFPVAIAAGIALAVPHLLAEESPTGPGLATANTQGDGLTITEFVDFQCPACRALHGELKKALAATETPVNVVRKHMPLARHTEARGAALAYCCAEEFGKAEEMADMLFTAKDLSPDGCERMAQEAGVPLDAYRTCMAEERGSETLEADAALAEELGIRALPTFFVGSERFEGVRRSAEVETLIARAAEHSAAHHN